VLTIEEVAKLAYGYVPGDGADIKFDVMTRLSEKKQVELANHIYKTVSPSVLLICIDREVIEIIDMIKEESP